MSQKKKTQKITCIFDRFKNNKKTHYEMKGN